MYVLITVTILLIFGFILYKIFQSKEKESHQWRKQSAKNIFKKLKTMEHDGQMIAYLRKIDHFVFEELLLLAVEQNLNCKAIHNNKYTGDGGVDGRFYLFDNKNNKKLYLVQAKRYKSHIDNQDILKFSSLVKNEDAELGLFIHTGKSGSQSRRNTLYCNNVKIISSDKLCKLIRFGYRE